MSDGDALLTIVLAKPEDQATWLIWADWLDEHGEESRARAARTFCMMLGEPEAGALRTLSDCRMSPGSHASFVGDMLDYTKSVAVGLFEYAPVTLRQWQFLWHLVWRYRAQHADDKLLALAKSWAPAYTWDTKKHGRAEANPNPMVRFAFQMLDDADMSNLVVRRR